MIFWPQTNNVPKKSYNVSNVSANIMSRGKAVEGFIEHKKVEKLWSRNSEPTFW